MRCPKCGGALEERKIGTVEVDECVSCRGIWFDADELRRAKDHAEPDANWLDFEIWRNNQRFRTSSSSVDCPACASPLVALNYGATEIEIDHCPSCLGTWLDQGEFKKIVEALAHELDSKSTAEYVAAAIQEAREIATGPESLLSEWRDFTTVLRLLQYRFLIDNPKLQQAIAEIQRSSPIR